MKNYEYGTSRSYKYQYYIREATYSEADWVVISTLFPVHHPLPVNIVEELYLLDDALQRIMWQHIETDLSESQKSVCKLYRLAIAQEEGQEWIAKRLGINQSSVAKAIFGTAHPKKCNNNSGIRRKLTTAIKRDCKMQEIIGKMTEMGADRLSPRDIPHWACFRKI